MLPVELLEIAEETNIKPAVETEEPKPEKALTIEHVVPNPAADTVRIVYRLGTPSSATLTAKLFSAG